ncbi:MAG TPA: outer-membrane lipoprotein carrier protein LolA [Spirochaetota bacterium]|nr:outer membrane lipoprotein carrier protein LolA [Spirochaetota bacterium]HOR93960.1 outer-membrane lipoprotein carrier protein LolA [Spirochaetota bacterium]HRR61373.1 outer-membrane lipoprotein carrier protein LolA [Spirochaetota bacterium]
MKKLFTITVLVFIVVSSLFALTGEEAIIRFQQRMRSINTLSGNISWTTSNGFTYTGTFKYKAPDKLYLNLTAPGGKAIVTNGKKLWVYDKSSNICGVQDVGDGYSGGIASIVSGYNALLASQGTGGYTIKLRNFEKAYPEIVIVADSNFLLKKLILKDKQGDSTTYTISNLIAGENIPNGYFDFKPPTSAQTVKNPLNIQ